MTIKVTDIVYDTDSDTDIELPKELTFDIEDDDSIGFDERIDLEDIIADMISDKTGWCVISFDFEIA